MSEAFELFTPEPAAWDGFVAECDEANVCHTSAWARVWTSEWPGARWQAIAWRDDERRLRAGLPLIERSSPLGRRVLSMPDGTYGGPLAAGGLAPEARSSALRALLRAYREAAARGAALAQLTWRPEPADRALAEGFEEGFTQVVPLRAGFEAAAQRWSHGTRSRVRQAEEAGLTLRAATVAEDVRVYHSLAERNARRHGGRARPLSLYLRVLEHLVPGGLARFDLVEHRGQAIGGSLHLLYGGRALNWLTVADEARRNLHPHHLVIARWLRELCAAGYREYDLGGSPAEARGLIEFKESWGAERRPVLTWRRRGGLYRLLGR